MLLTPQHFSASRRFPHLSWAWPAGHRQQLLIAAAHTDESLAADTFVNWLSTTNLDDAHFAEQRLLVTAANRFPETRLKVPNRARLNGIVRMLWTKSRLSLNNAAPMLKALRSEGVELLVFKGMAQTALEIKNLKGRIAHDVDVLLRDYDLAAAFSILDSAGWRPARGESALFLKERGAHFRSLNFLKPPFGDIDLHTRAFVTTSRRSNAETMLWARSTRTQLLGTDVLVPSPTDRLMIAIAHGSLDAHRHSDWLVDCAQVIGEANIDWQLVAKLSEDLAVSAQVALALSYLREILAVAIPEDVFSQLWEKARSSQVDYFKALLLGYPRDQHSLVSSVGRRIYKMQQSARVKAANAGDAGPPSKPDIKMRRAKLSTAIPDTPPAMRHRLDVASGAGHCSLIVGMDAIGRPRRYVFEINTSERHVARLKFKDLLGRGPLLLTAEIPLPRDVAAGDLWIEARQSGILTALHSTEQDAAFGARPFRVVVN